MITGRRIAIPQSTVECPARRLVAFCQKRHKQQINFCLSPSNCYTHQPLQPHHHHHHYHRHHHKCLHSSLFNIVHSLMLLLLLFTCFVRLSSANGLNTLFQSSPSSSFSPSPIIPYNLAKDSRWTGASPQVPQLNTGQFNNHQSHQLPFSGSIHNGQSTLFTPPMPPASSSLSGKGGGLRSLFSSIATPGRNRSPTRSSWTNLFNPFRNQEQEYSSSSLNPISVIPIAVQEHSPAAITFDMPSNYATSNGYQYVQQPSASSNNLVAIRSNSIYPSYEQSHSQLQSTGLAQPTLTSTNLVKTTKSQRPIKRRRRPKPPATSGPTISIGGAPGGGTSIRFGKAQITFRKGSVSVGPAASETRPRRYRPRKPRPSYPTPNGNANSRGVSINLGKKAG